MSKKIKAAVIGLGVGMKHIQAINSCKNSEVIGIYDFDKKKNLFYKKKISKT